MMRIMIVLAMFLMWPQGADAVLPSEVLADPVLELRARDISKNLRCLVCQNQSIDDSDADLAKDLRVLVRQRLTAGDSDGQIIEYVVSRYGDFVLLDPPFKNTTLVLWIGPGLLALMGIGFVVLFYRRGQLRVANAKLAPVAALNDEETKRLAQLLGDSQS